ncbi:MAG: tyrosine-type recombinase/integrase [Flavisolibacter sp.]
MDAITHRNKEWIALRFLHYKLLAGMVSQLPDVKWSQTFACWLLPLDRNHYQKLVEACKGKVVVDHVLLKQFLENKKNRNRIQDGIAGSNLEQGKSTNATVIPQQPVKQFMTGISEVNRLELSKTIEMLTLKAYSKSTMKTYRNELAVFFRALGSTPAINLTEEQLKRYLLYCHEKLRLSENTLHSRMNALKFYYEQVLKRHRFFWDIPRPKRPMQLPKLLNEDELARLFNALTNKKHKAMLFTAYSAGLRVSEIVNLRLTDIDSVRMQIFVRKAKGKKDRYVNLSPVLLDILRSYNRDYHPRPKEYLFESEQTFTAYPVRTVQQIFTNAKKKAGIRKEVGVHSLRHSFATQLLDKGTDIRYIKDLLGHFNIKTTERYLHVSKAKLVNISSPFDDLWKTHKLDW